jgi:hypothetical protein
MKYLDLIWKCIYWSAIWSIGLCVFSIFIIPDTPIGFILSVFISPIFGIPTAIVKNFQNEKVKKSL